VPRKSARCLVPGCGICDIGVKARSRNRDYTEFGVNPLGMRSKWAVLLRTIQLTFPSIRENGLSSVLE